MHGTSVMPSLRAASTRPWPAMMPCLVRAAALLVVEIERYHRDHDEGSR
jgi:hypothetical protein